MVLTPAVITLLPFVLVVIILSFIALNRYINYKERVALARLGFSVEDLNRAASPPRRGSRGVLWGGVITAMSGLALLLGLATLGIGAWLLAGLLPLFVGLGMVIIYFTTSGVPPEQERTTPRALDGDLELGGAPDSQGSGPDKAVSGPDEAIRD